MSSKQRDVLGKIAENIDRALSILNEIPKSCSHNGLVEDVADVLCLVKETYIPEALAEPLLNCEVGTAEEQVKRFATFCLFRKCDKCELDNDSNFLDCGIRWTQLPYVKGEINENTVPC